MTKVELYQDKRVNRIVSHLPGVRAAVADAALDIGVEAEARLLSHRDYTNATNHQIEVEQGRVDSYVYLTGPAPMSVEFGHWVEGKYKPFAPTYVPGLYIISQAAGVI